MSTSPSKSSDQDAVVACGVRVKPVTNVPADAMSLPKVNTPPFAALIFQSSPASALASADNTIATGASSTLACISRASAPASSYSILMSLLEPKMISLESAIVIEFAPLTLLLSSTIKPLFWPVLPPVPSKRTKALSVDEPGPLKSPEAIALPATVYALPEARSIPPSSIVAISTSSIYQVTLP